MSFSAAENVDDIPSDHSVHCVDLKNIDEDINVISCLVGEKCFKSALLNAVKSGQSQLCQVFSVDIGLKTPGHPNTFSVKVREMGTMADFEAAFSERQTVMCHQCREYIEARNAMRCSGCRKAVYCSKACQKKAWQLHKTKCSKAYL